MEIITLLKANIRHKKGSFVSIILLMILISMSLTAILSVRDNCKSGLERELNQVNASNLSVYLAKQNMTDELMQSLMNHETVKKVTDTPAIVTQKAEINGQKDGNELRCW